VQTAFLATGSNGTAPTPASAQPSFWELWTFKEKLHQSAGMGLSLSLEKFLSTSTVEQT